LDDYDIAALDFTNISGFGGTMACCGLLRGVIAA
jgi:hypothetical protein